MSTPFITVITATAGARPSMLTEAVDSVRAQTLTTWEHIVVDDGSFSVPEIPGATVLHIDHLGHGPARNKAIEHARGTALAFLDDDDLWLPDHLEVVSRALDETGADVVYADCEQVNRRDGYLLEPREFDAEALRGSNYICLDAVLVRRSSFEQTSGFGDDTFADWTLWKRMLDRGMTFVHVPRVTSIYRFHTDNMTYGGVDPLKTAEQARLRADAEAGILSWDEYADLVTRLWE